MWIKHGIDIFPILINIFQGKKRHEKAFVKQTFNKINYVELILNDSTIYYESSSLLISSVEIFLPANNFKRVALIALFPLQGENYSIKALHSAPPQNSAERYYGNEEQKSRAVLQLVKARRKKRFYGKR